MKKSISTLLLFFLIGLSIQSLNGQTISGKITDKETGEELIGAHLKFYDDEDQMVAETYADLWGNYNLAVDGFSVAWMEVVYVGYETLRITEIVGEEKVDVSMGEPEVYYCDFGGSFYQVPLIDLEFTSCGQKFTQQDIRNSTARGN